MKYVFLISIVFLITSAGCSPSHDSALGLASGDLFILNPSPDPILRSAAQNVLTNRCYTCHGPGGSFSAIFEDAGGGLVDMDALVANSRYTAIGDPDNSLLYEAIFTVPMPGATPADTFLSSQTEQADIANWIADVGILDDSGGGTGGGGGGGGGPAATFSQVESQVLTPQCYSCHATQAPVFSDFASVRATIVLANNPDSAFLRVIQDPVPADRMPPPPNDALSPALISLVESWILDGATNN